MSSHSATTVDYFTFLGVPRKLRLDPAALDQRFRDLSRQFHPDFFHNAPAAERRASLERSSYLNEAYRTLKQPGLRMTYLLAIESGVPLTPNGLQSASTHTGGQVPTSLLEEVFALNEELDAVRELRANGAPAATWKARLEHARGPIEAKRAEHDRQFEALADEWDALDAEAGAADTEADANTARREALLTSLRGLLLERNYIANLLAGIEQELAHA